MEFKEIISNIKKRNFAPVYFLHGEEPFFIDAISETLEKSVLKEEEKGFNQLIMYGKETDTSTIINNAKRFPMMSDFQLIIVREAQEIKDIDKENGQELFISYLNKPLNSTILVLCYKNKKYDSRKKLAKELLSKGVFFHSEKVKDYKLPDWIKHYVIENGFKINDQASFMLSEYIGNNLNRISNEIKKLSISLPKGSEIDQVTIQRQVGISKDYNIFELQKALAGKQSEKCHLIVNYFASNPKNNPLILSITQLFNYFIRVLYVQVNPSKSDDVIAKELGVSPFAIKEYKSATKNYPRHKLINILSFIHQADLQSKGIGFPATDEGQILRELVSKILLV